MLRRTTIAARMTLLIVAGAGVILGAIIAYSYVTARRLLEQELRDKACYLAAATAAHIETVQRSVEKVAESLAYMLRRPVPQEAVYELLEAMVARNPEVYGAAMAPEYRPGARLVAPYVCRSREPGGGFQRMDLAGDNYRYYVWDWYTLPHSMGRAQWTEPYFDEGAGAALMVTYAVPLFGDTTNDFLGVVTCDVSLQWLGGLMASLPVGSNGYAFLASGTGNYIAHRRKDFIMNESTFSVAEENNSPSLRDFARRMARGETGFGELVSLVTGKASWIAYAPVPSTGWSVALVFPKEELLARVASLSRALSGVGLLGFGLLLAIALAIARSISGPVRQLEAATKTLATGNLDAPLPAVRGDDEVAHLAQSFDAMRRDLKQHIERLRETTAAKERIESEMHIARTIQMSLVPRTFPPFPERADLDLYALLDPARDIGGDFYDFFIADGDDLCLVIGDVSGKGIPAALFMAVTRTFLKIIWQEERDPAATLKRLNDELARDNEETMFVTLFLARIHLPTGRCSYANGGHNPPFVLGADGQVRRVPHVKGAVVGAVEGLAFEEGSCTFRAGETLFLYTDGVTEAMDPAGKLAGEEWAMARVAEARQDDCTQLVKDVREALRRYAAGAEQSDDITMVAFRRR